MMEKFQQLEPRQQLLFGGGGLLVLLVLCWQFIWVPLQNRSASLADRVASTADLVVDLRLAAQLNNSAGGGVILGSDSDLSFVVRQTAGPLGIESTFGSVRPIQGGSVHVQLRNAPFDTLMTWLDLLARQHGIAVVSADMARSNVTGIVNGQIVLQRG